MMQNYHNEDPETSEEAWNSVKDYAATLRLRLLRHFEDAHPEGLTDEEVSLIEGVEKDSGGRKRCSDLRNLGHIAPTGETRPGNSGRQQMVCVITGEGRDFYYESI